LVAERFYLVRNFAYTKAVRLRKRAEFIFVSTFGKRVQNRHFIACFIPNHQRTSRLGITVTKRVGKAVARNRIKRSAREYFRLSLLYIEDHLDMNVIAKKESAVLTSEEIFFSLDNLFQKIKRDCGH
jgi:ribonuclease P protein component